MSPNDFQVHDGPLTVRWSDQGTQVNLAVDGELDLSNAATLESALAQAIDSEKKVLIDLGKLEFLDSTGIALIVKTLGRRDAERFSFLPSQSSSVCRLLELTGLDERMVISSPVEEQTPLPAV
jgi:anti-sigma B factor antagonist